MNKSRDMKTIIIIRQQTNKHKTKQANKEQNKERNQRNLNIEWDLLQNYQNADMNLLYSHWQIVSI